MTPDREKWARKIPAIDEACMVLSGARMQLRNMAQPDNVRHVRLSWISVSIAFVIV